MPSVLKAAFASAALLGAWSVAAPASAGVYSDDLTRCLVKSTTPEDRITLIRWVFSAMSAHPTLAELTRVDDATATKFNGEAGSLFNRLLLKDCRSETAAALKYEQSSAIESAFGTLGEVAMSGIMTNPKVAGRMEGLAQSMDPKAFEAFAKENGLK